MLQSILCLAAKGVIRDVQTNNISVFEILEQLRSSAVPFVLQESGLLAVWKRSLDDAAQFDVTLRVVNNGELLFEQPINVVFSAGSTTNRSVVSIMGLVVK